MLVEHQPPQTPGRARLENEEHLRSMWVQREGGLRLAHGQWLEVRVLARLTSPAAAGLTLHPHYRQLVIGSATVSAAQQAPRARPSQRSH